MLSGVIISALKGSKVWLQQGENVLKTGSFLFQLLCHPFHLFLAAPLKMKRRNCFQHGALCTAASLLSSSPSHCLTLFRLMLLLLPEILFHQFSSAQLLSCVQFFATPWTAAHQDSLSTVHHHLPGFTQTHVHWVGDAIQPSPPLLLLPSIFPSIRVFSNESVLLVSPLPSAYFKLPSRLCKHLPQVTLSHHSSLVNQWFPSSACLRVHLIPKWWQTGLCSFLNQSVGVLRGPHRSIAVADV